MQNDFWIGAGITFLAMILLYSLFGNREPERVEVMRTDTLRSVEVIRDTVIVTVRDSIYIREIVPRIEDDVAVLDTILDVAEPLPQRQDSLRLSVHLSLGFDLTQLKFRQVNLGFPCVQIPVDTVIISERITQVMERKKGIEFFKIVEIGLVGACAGIILYSVVQGI